jgi:ceramide glucosyltransferase
LLSPDANGKKQKSIPSDVLEGVTILRPIKGIDPELYSCLRSSFDQDYPTNKLQIIFCVDDPADPAIPIIKKLMLEYPHIDSEIQFSENFNPQTKKSDDYYGPNPKVNNLAKGFRYPKFDILWVMDSNVWASSNILKNSVKTLNENLNNGQQLTGQRKVRLVHHVPLALSINNSSNNSDLEYSLSPSQSFDSYRRVPSSKKPRFLKKLGAKLDEMFLFTSHSKFYIALNKLSIGACVNGKSNIYRRSDIDVSVANIPSKKSSFFSDESVIDDARVISNKGPGHAIEFFSRYIGEDNMIAISLWDNLDSRTGQTTDLVIQPLSGTDNSVRDYINRRVRWLRVRKYMVMMATLIEPTTESIICGLIGNYGISIVLYNRVFTPWLLFIHMVIWIAIDYIQYYTLIDNITSTKNCAHQPEWLKNIPPTTRSFGSWLYIWVIREILALPIWITAMVGHEIDWRGTPFRIKQDLTAEELYQTVQYC